PWRRSKSTWSFARTPGNALTIPRASMASGGDSGAGAAEPGASAIVIDPIRKRRGPRASARGPPARCLAQLRQWNGDVLVPPVHANRALRPGGAGRELVEIGLLELLPGRQELRAGVVLDRSREDVEAPERPVEHLGEKVLDLLDVRRRQVADALLWRLALH